MDKNDSNNTPRGNASSTLVAVMGAAMVLLACNVYLFWRVNRLETGTAHWSATASQQISELREALSVNGVTQAKNMEALRSELDEARQQATVTAGHAKIEAQKHAERLAKMLADEQQQQQQQVASELTQIKQSAATTNSKIADVSTDVAATKSDVAATKLDLQNTASELKRVTGDMGVLSDRIATNGSELAALRALGERNYFEFNIAKSKPPQKVANVQVSVKKADPKRSRFTLVVLADDKTVEKRDRTINEPVQFYVGHSRQPYEIVVNEVTKDHIIGYLATPKVEMARK